jgi:chromosome segregation ATPase
LDISPYVIIIALVRFLDLLQELDDERCELKQQQRELHGRHSQLQSDKAAKETHFADLEARCREVQLLKFGQVIDVSLLDAIGVRNRGVEELREQLKQQVRPIQAYAPSCAEVSLLLVW